MEDREFEGKTMRAVRQNNHGHWHPTPQTVQARKNQPNPPHYMRPAPMTMPSKSARLSLSAVTLLICSSDIF
jgi:hypothetical protein